MPIINIRLASHPLSLVLILEIFIIIILAFIDVTYFLRCRISVYRQQDDCRCNFIQNSAHIAHFELNGERLKKAVNLVDLEILFKS